MRNPTGGRARDGAGVASEGGGGIGERRATRGAVLHFESLRRRSVVVVKGPLGADGHVDGDAEADVLSLFLLASVLCEERLWDEANERAGEAQFHLSSEVGKCLRCWR